MVRMVLRIALYLIVILIVLFSCIILFTYLHPAFGGKLTKEQKENYRQFDNYADGEFLNEIRLSFFLISSRSSSTGTDFSSSLDVIERKPAEPIPVSTIDWSKIKSEKDSITWLGHSAFILSIDNKKLLLDPMLGPMASPVSFIGIKRFKYSEDILQKIIEEMPPIDGVFITHDHYDHLDYGSILKLKDKAFHFFVPLGVSTHLIRWGVPEEKITELNWWQEKEYEGLTIALTPASHFSGRGLFDRNATLWGGWVILGEDTRIYTSGDGGYGPHFKKIGEKYGPFDLALIEGAQYDPRWPYSHMTPEQSIQTNIDVEGKNMILMHWGAFTLANHGWKEPIERALIEAEKAKVHLLTPKIGETVFLD